MVARGSHWRVAEMRPGSDPVANLARALSAPDVLGHAGSEQDLETDLTRATLKRGGLGLVEAVKQARLGADENLLVLVDQFEELFRYKQADTDGADRGAAFVRLLLEAAQHPDVPVYVVVTMRSDFLGDCALFPNLPEAINDGLYLVPRMRFEQVKRAIEGPIGVANARIAPGLVNQLINDLNDLEGYADQLPVLQHVLMRTWDIWQGDPNAGDLIDLRHYEATGGMAEALSRHGDEVYNSLPSDRSRVIAEHVFKALTQSGGDNRDGIRRPTRFGDACAITQGSVEELTQVVEAFASPTCSFIMISPRDKGLAADTMLDISHESLMRIWARLKNWVKEEARSAETYRRIATAAGLHAGGQEDLLRDPYLSVALAWRDENDPNEAWAARVLPDAEDKVFPRTIQFLEASAARRAGERSRSAQRLWMTIVVLAAAVILLLALSTVAFTEKNKAQEALGMQRAERLADISTQTETGSIMGSLLGAEAYATAETPRTASALLSNLTLLDELAHVSLPAPWSHGAFADRGAFLGITTGVSPNDSSLVVMALPASIPRDINLLTHTRRLPGQPSMLCGVRGAPQFAVADRSNVRLYAVSGTTEPTLVASRELGPIDSLACMTKANSVAVATSDGSVKIVDMVIGKSITLGSAPGSRFGGVVVSSNGHAVAAIANGMTSFDVYEVVSRAKLGHVEIQHPSCPGDACAAQVVFSPDERQVAWLDGADVRVAELHRLDAPKSYGCRECLRVTSALIWGNAPLPLILVPGRHDQYNPTLRAYEGHVEYTVSSPDAPLPFVDYDYKKDGPRFVTSESDGLAIRSLADVNYPLIGDPKLLSGTVSAENLTRARGSLAVVAPDGRIEARSISASPIQLYDTASHGPIGQEPLPPPPLLATFLALRFSEDGRYLKATYDGTDGRRWLATYVVDPKLWKDEICRRVKGAIPKKELRDFLKANLFDEAHGFEFRNACGLT